jgi:ferredoxin
MRVWIDQDLCTGDGLCTDHCPEVFVLLEDGISYVRDAAGVAAGPGGRDSVVLVPDRHDDAVIAAALDCPGECIFIEPDADGASDEEENEDDIEPADIVSVSSARSAVGAGRR